MESVVTETQECKKVRPAVRDGKKGKRGLEGLHVSVPELHENGQRHLREYSTCADGRDSNLEM